MPDGPLGVVRAHGGKGAYVSEWVIVKKTLKVLSGADLMSNVYQLAADGSWSPVPATGVLGQTSSFARFCSADLAERSAFYDNATHKGTRQRIFLNGEESSPTYQRGLAHVATGPDKGSSYVLPWAANAGAAWENLLANPYSGERTVVIGNADGGTNGIYVYVGKKTARQRVERAGLIGGTLYRVAVNDTKLPETRAADAGLGLAVNGRGNYEGGFSLVAGPDTTNSQSTKFLRPEDGAWDTKNHNRYFFVTTDQMDAAKEGSLNTDIAAGQVGRSRLWALTFKNSAKPELGGSIEMLLDGTAPRATTRCSTTSPSTTTARSYFRKTSATTSTTARSGSSTRLPARCSSWPDSTRFCSAISAGRARSPKMKRHPESSTSLPS